MRNPQVGDMVTIEGGKNSGKVGRYVRDDLIHSGQDRIYPVIRLDDGTHVRVVTIALADATVVAEVCVRVLLADAALGVSCGKRHVVPPENAGDAGHEWHCLRRYGHEEQCRPYPDRPNTAPYPAGGAS